MDSTGGLLHITIGEAKLTREEDHTRFPCCRIEYCSRKYETSMCRKSSQNPIWNESFDIYIGSMTDEIMIEMKDMDMTGGMVVIGSNTINASSLCVIDGVKEWFSIRSGNETIGELLLETKFTPKY